MLQEFITVGHIVNAHGIRGEMRLRPQGFDPEFLLDFKTLYLDGVPVRPTGLRIHKEMVLLTIPQVTDMDGALARKGTTVTIRRADARLPKGEYFDQELIGLGVYDAKTHAPVGELTDILSYPAHKLFAVTGEKSYLIPAVPGVFIEEVDMAAGRIYIHMMEGLSTNEN